MDALDRPGTAKLAQVLHVGPCVLDAPCYGWRCSKQAGGNSRADWQERLQRAPERGRSSPVLLTTLLPPPAMLQRTRERGRSSPGIGGEVAVHAHEVDDTIEQYPEGGGEEGGDDQGVDPIRQANE